MDSFNVCAEEKALPDDFGDAYTDREFGEAPGDLPSMGDLDRLLDATLAPGELGDLDRLRDDTVAPSDFALMGDFDRLLEVRTLRLWWGDRVPFDRMSAYIS
jgi:hypothetical protein